MHQCKQRPHLIQQQPATLGVSLPVPAANTCHDVVEEAKELLVLGDFQVKVNFAG